MDRQIIKVDIDGVIRDLVNQMIKIYNANFETSITISDIKEYDIRKVFKLVDVDKFFFKEKAKLLYEGASILPKADLALKLLVDSDKYYVNLVSNQPNTSAMISTINWLKEYNIAFNGLTFTKLKHIENGNILIDDCIANLESEPENVRKICIIHNYNNEWTGEKYNSLYDAVINILKQE